jgi:putative transposase
MLKAIKIRLYPSNDQVNYISNLFGCCRVVFNEALKFKSQEYGLWNNNTGLKDTSKFINSLKEIKPWLFEVHSKVKQQSLIDLETAFKNFFRGSGYTKLKSKHGKQSCRFPVDAISGIKGNRINIINTLRDIHYKCSKSDEKYLNKNQDMIKSGTLSKTKSGKYYFSILIDKQNKQINKTGNNIIGIDLGIKDFIVTSDNIKFKNLKLKRNNEKILSRLHRSVSKKVKGSNNRNKARLKLAIKYEKLNNQKEYYLHEIVNQLLSENQTIVIEDLNVNGMLKNHKLAKSIQEVSFSRFKTILNYKAEWYGREVIMIDRWFHSSKLCNKCGYKNDDLTLRDRVWTCPVCGAHLDRDHNAAQNIKNEGIRIKIGLSSPKLTLQESKSIRSSVNEETNSKILTEI